MAISNRVGSTGNPNKKVGHPHIKVGNPNKKKNFFFRLNLGNPSNKK
jgi:hypothetical protein